MFHIIVCKYGSKNYKNDLKIYVKYKIKINIINKRTRFSIKKLFML